MKKRIIYLVTNELLGPVFDAIVLRRLGALATRGYDVHLVTTVPLGHFVRRSARRSLRMQVAKCKRVLSERVYVVPTAPSRLRRWWNDSLGVGLVLTRLAKVPTPSVIYCRGSYAASVALNARRLFGLTYKIVEDLPGIQWAEKWYDNHPDVRLSLANVPADAIKDETAEAEIVKSADQVIAVSHRMADYVIARFGIQPERVTTLWNAVDLKPYDDALSCRDEIRASLGLEGKFVIVYCGSVYPRQRVPEAFRVIERILQRWPSAYFLVLTTNPRRMIDAFAAAAIPADRASIHSIAFQETSRFLCAADLGLITTGFFETPHLANEVCCPVKFAEYLAAGLPVVMSDHVGDYSAYVSEQGIGVSIPPETTVDTAVAMVEDLMRRILVDETTQLQRCRFLGRKDFDFETYLDRLISVLKDMHECPDRGTHSQDWMSLPQRKLSTRQID
jgi:glycosyltransferase involved in cell wall biosynthesis